MARNSDYFTFYINNSNNDDLSTKIGQLEHKLTEKEQSDSQKEEKNKEQH